MGSDNGRIDHLELGALELRTTSLSRKSIKCNQPGSVDYFLPWIRSQAAWVSGCIKIDIGAFCEVVEGAIQR